MAAKWPLQINSSNVIEPASLPGGLYLVSSQSASSSASIDFTNLSATGYNEFFLEMSGVQPVTNGSYLRMEVSNDNGSTWSTTGYATGLNYHAYNSATTTNQNSTSAFDFANSIGNTQIFSGYGYIYDISQGRFISLMGKSIYKTSASTLTIGDFGGQSGITGVNALRFLMNSGNIFTGTFSLYGVKES